MQRMGQSAAPLFRSGEWAGMLVVRHGNPARCPSRPFRLVRGDDGGRGVRARDAGGRRYQTLIEFVYHEARGSSMRSASTNGTTCMPTTAVIGCH